MAVLDIISHILLDADVPVEDLAQPAGRIWDTVLQYAIQKRGCLGAYWGRDLYNPSTVTLFIIWNDLSCREEFHYGGLGTSMIDFYLRTGPARRYLLVTENTELLARGSASIVITTFDNIPASEIPAAQESHKECSDEKMRVLLGDKIYCSQLFSGFEPSTPSERVAVVTLLFSNGSEPMTAEACKALDTQGHRAGWSMELLNVIVEHPITPLKTQSLLHISDIFLRDPSSFDKPQTIQISDMTPEHPGPQLTWRSPDQSYSRYCFKEGQAKEAYPTSPPLGQSQTYSELSSFQFVLVVPEPSDTITEAGIVWWEYRAALMSQTGCRGICRIAYPDRPHVVDLLIDWDSADNSAAAKAEAVVIQRLDSLASHLAATPWPSPLSGTPFASLSGDIPWAEVVDFNLLPTATFSDRRAFEFYIHDFCGIMDSDPYFHDADGRLLNDISPDQAVDDIHVGWIDRTDPSTIVDNSRSPISVTYRILFTWTSEKDERHWIKEFMESQYQVLGYRAHAVALLVEDVRGTIFTVEKEVRSNFRSADEHSDSDESLGF